MKFKTFLLTFIASLFLLTSCMEAVNRRGKLEDESAQESGDYIVENPTPASWYANSQFTTGALTLSTDDDSSVYIVGGAVNNFLVEQNKENAIFCLVLSINNSVDASKKAQARFKATPIKSLSSQEMSLRINTSNALDNEAFCGGNSILSYNSDGTSITPGVAQSDAAFSTEEICPTCNSLFSSVTLTLHESSYGFISNTFVPSTDLNFGDLVVTIDSKSDVSAPIESCTNDGCQKQGYGCCLNGQCVMDGEVRPSTDTSSTNMEYQTALAEILNDSKAFRNYPEMFFVCPINVAPGEDDEDEGDPLDDANQNLLKDIADYKCLQGDLTQCSTDLDTVRTEVWKKCGCQFEPTFVSGVLQLDSRCIDYGLKAQKDVNENILNITCDTPETQNVDKPFQNLSVLVSGKSAPHRFFSLGGVPYDDLQEVPEGTNQEGDTFFYLDDANKAGPAESEFSMNSVIGQMSLDLQQAQPAKAVDLELDRMYIISVTTGFSTPCLYCQNDAWQKVLRSHPESSKGYGLTWRGYTTDRQQVGSNTTFGNYEDTVFGRACWVPPTMLHGAHMPYADAGVQRRNRLITQAAMYVNGYQRDWYGFNQGALIGSFDGVSWFAVGAGRRVRSTSRKLLLAINAPFADLSQNTNYTVSVVEDLGGQQAADYDYDFTKTPDDFEQNHGGSCQYMHACNTDSECVSKLGWEYMCAQVTDVKTNWPRFDIDAFEQNDSAKLAVSLSSILNGNISSGQNKRCVYRGAGAPCKVNPTATGEVKKTNQEKLLTCAPNFHCAALDSNKFNKELVRSPNEPTGIKYGQGANVLGRPAKYIDREDNLPQIAQDGIKGNLLAYKGTAITNDDDFNVGLCVPGRSTTGANFEARHEKENENNDVDFINQIATCNQDTTGASRTVLCPVFDDEGNYDISETAIVPSILQNMCAAASINDEDDKSSFKSIESERLADILQLQSEALAANSCLRRAGSVCHTNLDCGPNRLHSDIARGLSPSAFGNTEAEQNFWEESLVCGQSTPEPLLNTIFGADYYNYDMSQNRCCREISKGFSMHTEVRDQTWMPGYNSANESLRTNISSNDQPRDEGRYSRYLASETYNNGTKNISVSSATDPSANQAKVINETGRANCCGGGFIRKFEDGTNNWTAGGRLNLSPKNFACINYSMPSWREELNSRDNWLIDYSFMSALGGYRTVSGTETYVWLRAGDPLGSIQAMIREDSNLAPVPINSSDLSGRVNLYPADDSGALVDTKIAFGAFENISGVNSSFNLPYSPQLYRGTGFTNDIAPAMKGGLDLQQKFMAIYVPDFVDLGTISNVDFNYLPDNTLTDFADLTGLTSAAMTQISCTSLSTARTDLSGQFAYCVFNDNGTNYMALSIDNTATWAGETQPLGFPSFQYELIDNFGLIPGGQEYYEKIFERYELLGIPQIAYEAIRCNDEFSPEDGGDKVGQLIDGVYNSIATDSAATNIDPYYDDSDTIAPTATDERKVFFKTDGETITLPQIFSADEFQCCSKLGTSVSDPGSMCCSGFGVLNTNGTFECRLPKGTDVNLYLNLFISSEGIVTEDENMSLDPDSDYDERTGYPKDEDDINVKISQIGQRFCQNGSVRNGAAFDEFYPQPAAGYFTDDSQLTSYNSIVDSLDDLTANDANYSSFISGLRWNHHQYCD